MNVSKNFSIDLDDLIEIEKIIKKGEFKSASEIVQLAIREYINKKRREN